MLLKHGDMPKQIHNYLFIYFLFCYHLLTAQSTDIEFKVNYKQTALELNHSYQGNNVEIETLRFYISNIQLYKQGNPVFTEKESYHLIDWSDVESCKFNLATPEDLDFDEIHFLLGIDEETHEAGVMGGDLDPTRGMYWSWQSGYINFKLEGKQPQVPTPIHDFQFHLGGFLAPFYNAQAVQLTCTNTDQIQIQLNLDQLLDKNDWTSQHKIMSPSEEAVNMAKLVSQLFTITETK